MEFWMLNALLFAAAQSEAKGGRFLRRPAARAGGIGPAGRRRMAVSFPHNS
jgi:hypothetical protein